MAMITLICPKCGGQAKLSLVDATYVGPRRCWKCHEYFTIRIENSRLISCEPLSEEEFERQQEEKKAAEKAQGGISFSRRDEPEPRPVVQEKQLDFISSLNQKKPSAQAAPSGPPSTFPPEKVQPFMPEQNTHKEPDKPKKPKTAPEKQWKFPGPSSQKAPQPHPEPGNASPVFPADRVRTFIPLEEIEEEVEKPQKSKKSAEKFNTFIPPAG